MMLTNAELAAYFASLPPNEKGMIFLINCDTASMEEESLKMVTAETLEDVDSDFIKNDLTGTPKAINHPCIVQKW